MGGRCSQALRLPKSTTVRPSLLAHLFTAPLMLLVEFVDPAYVIRNGVDTRCRSRL